jgi:hypothetical protein
MSGFDGDFDPSVVNFPDISFSPSFETGTTWATQYTPITTGVAAISQGGYYVSNFITRDIAGRTTGICVNPFDFNYVKARTVEGGVVARPDEYNRTSFQKCDCSYYKCDREFDGIGYTLDFNLLWNGEDTPGVRNAFNSASGVSGAIYQVNETFRQLGFPFWKYTTASPYDVVFGGQNKVIKTITKEKFTQYKQELMNLDIIVQGRREANLLTYALIDFCDGSVTAGVNFKNNLVSALAFGQNEITLTIDDYGDFESGFNEEGWENAARDIVYNYERTANIPGFDAEFLFKDFTGGGTGTENIQEKCMCLDGSMYGYDAYPFADALIVKDQLVNENGAGGIEALQAIGFNGTAGDERGIAEFLCLDGQFLKTLGITQAKNYKYGPNWLDSYGYSQENVICLSNPEYKNWEVRDSAKMRISGTPNGEPYSFSGRQWLDWGQRIGIPSIDFVGINPVSLGGGDFADANFGYKGNLEGSLIYKGRLNSKVLPYEESEYEFAFKGNTYIPAPGQAGTEVFLSFTTIRHIDAVTNYDAYGVTGSIEDIVFSKTFSESPQDKTIYRM